MREAATMDARLHTPWAAAVLDFGMPSVSDLSGTIMALGIEDLT